MAAKRVAGDADRRRADARAAHRAGESPSEAGVTQGASKQIRHLTHQDGRHGSDGGAGGGLEERSFTDRDVAEYGPQHEQVFSALTESEASNGGEAVYLDQVADAAHLPREETRALLHDLVSVHKLVTELEGVDDPDLGPRFTTKPRL